MTFEVKGAAEPRASSNARMLKEPGTSPSSALVDRNDDKNYGLFGFRWEYPPSPLPHLSSPVQYERTQIYWRRQAQETCNTAGGGTRQDAKRKIRLDLAWM